MEEATEDLDAQEERVSTSDPPRVIRADSAAGREAVDVRMVAHAHNILNVETTHVLVFYPFP